jgi:hypothetical protein
MNNAALGKPVAPVVVLFIGLVTAAYLGTLIGGSETTTLLSIALGLLCVGVLAFVGNYWWAPLVLISALTFRTNFLGFMMTGIDIGVVVLAVLLPLKLAVRRLSPVEPPLKLGLTFQLLFAFVVTHAVVIVLYNKFQGVPLKNIVKAYYSVLAPLAFCWLLVRYCKPRTVRPVAFWTLATYTFVLAVSIPVIWFDLYLPLLNSRHFLFDWTYSGVAIGTGRSYGPILLAGMVAIWPAVRSPFGKAAVGIALLIAMLGSLVSASRVVISVCLVEIAVFCLLRRRFWVIAPLIVTVAVTTATISNNPDVLYAVPTTIHRTLTPFNLSSHHTSIQNSTELSNEWHEDLRRESLTYWTSDLGAFVVGHGFKAWDESLSNDPGFTRYYEDAKRLAVQMGRPENAVNSITNIFGLAGLLLYVAFLWQLYRRLIRQWRTLQSATYAKSICEFSIVTLVAYVLFSAWAGNIPGTNLIYFLLGLLVSRGKDARSSHRSRHEFTSTAGDLANIGSPADAALR